MSETNYFLMRRVMHDLRGPVMVYASRVVNGVVFYRYLVVAMWSGAGWCRASVLGRAL